MSRISTPSRPNQRQVVLFQVGDLAGVTGKGDGIGRKEETAFAPTHRKRCAPPCSGKHHVGTLDENGEGKHALETLHQGGHGRCRGSFGLQQRVKQVWATTSVSVSDSKRRPPARMSSRSVR